MTDDAHIEAAIIDDIVLIRVHGRGSFLNSRFLKDFLEKMLSINYSNFMFDLSHCQTMDSTFMGMLAGISIKLQEKGKGNICLVKPNKQCYRLLSTLGLDQILEVRSEFKNPSEMNPDFKDISPVKEYSQKEKLIHAIESHKNLIKLESQNKVKFENVLNLLEEDLEKYRARETNSNSNPEKEE